MKRMSTALLVLISTVLPFRLPGKNGLITYNSPEGRYKVAFPREPRISDAGTAGPSGEKILQHIAASSDSTGATYMVGYFDGTPQTKHFFEEAQNALIAAVRGTPLSERAISLGGYPGHEFRASFKRPDGSEYTVRARFFHVGARIYVMPVVVPKSSDNAMTEKKSVKYFHSFQVTRLH